jgi:hypothetical protein
VQNSGKERKARMMAVFSTIGIILIVCAGLLFAYQVMAALLGMGTSDSFVYENISLEDILSESTSCFVPVRSDVIFSNSHV